MTTLATLFYFTTTTLRCHTSLTIPCSDASHWKILSDYGYYAVLVHYYNDEILNYAHYAVLTQVIEKYFLWLCSLRLFSPLLLNWDIMLRSLHCFSSLLLLFTTILCALRMIRCLNTGHWKIIYLKQITEKHYLDYAHYAVLVHCY